MSSSTGQDFAVRPQRVADPTVLVIGYGNTLRRDDGVGAVVAARCREDARFGATDVREAYQLLPEMALDVADCSLVVFVDADRGVRPGAIDVRWLPATALDAIPAPGASSHHVAAGTLVALGAGLTGRRPAAVTVAIGVADLGAGDGLSPVVETAVVQVVETVWQLIDAHRRASAG